jgi:16S rRNA (uracil1498-N3)-methyltransferase
MRQFILPEDWNGGASCLVTGGRAHYVARVLRLGRGDRFPGRDSGGRLWDCRVLEAEPGRLLLAVLPRDEGAPNAPGGEYLPEELGSEGRVRIILAQGLPKGAKMDLIIRQAAEAGVAAVVPLLSPRAVPRGARAPEEGGRARLARWERIVREALQQSGSGTRPELFEPLPLSALPETLAGLGVGPADPRILLHEAPLAQSSMHGYLTGTPEAVVLSVGPEGGFAPDELDLLLSWGFKPLRLAGAVLRAETAALYAIAAAQIILSERSSWIPKPP